jgi:hypothetical protein
MSLGAGAGVTRSRGPTCGDATVEPAKARRCRPSRGAGVRSPVKLGALFRPPTRPLVGMRPGRMLPAPATRTAAHPKPEMAEAA